VLDLLAELPWWVTLIFGFILMSVSSGGNNAPVSLVFKMFAYACFLAAFVGGIKSLVRKSLFASANDIDAIRAMSWREFETLVGEAYRRQGYMVEETGGGGADGGIDLLLRGKGQKVIVQCKQWKTFKVGVKIVREMYGIMTAERADRVIIVASGTYTQEACDFARGKPIDLIEGKALVQLIKTVKGEPESAPVAIPSAASPRPQTTLRVQTQSAPACPKCGATMVTRTARQGANAGNTFWGCPKYPACRGIVSV
jgi:restriction system protein